MGTPTDTVSSGVVMINFCNVMLLLDKLSYADLQKDVFAVKNNVISFGTWERLREEKRLFDVVAGIPLLGMV